MLTSVHMKIHVLSDILLSWVYSFQHLKQSGGLQFQVKAAKKNDFLAAWASKTKQVGFPEMLVTYYQSMLCNIPEEPTFHFLWSHRMFCILLKIIFHITDAFGVAVFFIIGIA
jgi:hypothetical protein